MMTQDPKIGESFLDTSTMQTSTAGFSLVSVLVGVGLVGVSAVVISETVVSSRRAQQLVDAKLTANKYRQAAIEGITERVREFIMEDCKGDRWGTTGQTEVEKAFKEIQLTADNSVGIKLTFTTTPPSDLGVDCSPQGPTASDPDNPMVFCMKIDVSTPASITNSRKYAASNMDYRLLYLLINPVQVSTDQTLSCEDARGRSAAIKIAWQNFNVFQFKAGQSTSRTVSKESGLELVSADADQIGTCSLNPARVGVTNQCDVAVSGVGRRPPKLTVNSTELTTLTWTKSLDTFSTRVTCPTTSESTFNAQSPSGGITCSGSVPDALPKVCTLSVTRVAGNQCRIVSTGLGAANPVLRRNNVIISGLTWSNPVLDTYQTTTTCSMDFDTRFDSSSSVSGNTRTCKNGIRAWNRFIGNGNPHAFSQTAVPGGLPESVACESTAWKQIATQNGYASYVYGGTWDWKYMCRHNDGRYNYTSCGNNSHVGWNGLAWVRIPACWDSWTTRLWIYNPVPANYTPP